ncbi:DUF4129 domain-containing protein [Lysobacter sp.]|uniref:DUF4129 domain-containing protein n=1 Tax=Lysobacter sp. TaxID=72226 RepID=UPI002D4F44A8|nr:DUF4129 domain-containing protein [Lysobacter sp.]HZX76090.1 DUF4129 domain-containing protein [Lysobacter sp.]
MRIESLTVALRPRTAWEAVELGTALVRRHAAAIWKPWIALTLPVFVLINLFAWAIDMLWLGGLAMWWLKPAFDRVPLFVLSRAVFGDAPTPRQTLRAQRSWGVEWLIPHLTWRRLSLVRSLYLPVDLLEGASGSEARDRRRALGAPVYGVATLLTVVCLHFTLAVWLGIGGLVLLFVPNEYLSEIMQSLWKLLQDAPTWLRLASNAVMWLATGLIEPFYVGAGFGLYLNRRTQIEAWDIELTLRRLRARLLRGVAPLALLFAFGLTAMPSHAQETDEDFVDGDATEEIVEDVERDAPRVTLEEVFGRPLADDSGLRDGVNAQQVPQPAPPAQPVEAGNATLDRSGGNAVNDRAAGLPLADDRGLRDAVKRAYADPSVTPKRKVTTWKKRDPEKKKEEPRKPSPAPLAALGAVLAIISEYGLWIVVGVIVLVLLLTSPRWLRWFRGGLARERLEPGEVRRTDAAEVQAPLPEDIPGAIRRLWREGREREALAMLYRASVETMVARTETVLVPGATEAEVLRASRRMPRGEDRDVFARAVRVWQYAAYAQRLPGADEFEALLRELAERFAWSARPAVNGSAPA